MFDNAYTGTISTKGSNSFTLNNGTSASGYASLNYFLNNIQFNVVSGTASQTNVRIRITFPDGQAASYGLSTLSSYSAVPAGGTKLIYSSVGNVAGLDLYGQDWPDSQSPQLEYIPSGSLEGTIDLVSYDQLTVFDSVGIRITTSGSIFYGLSGSNDVNTQETKPVVTLYVDGIVPPEGRPGLPNLEETGLDYDFNVTNDDDEPRQFEIIGVTPDGEQISLTGGPVTVPAGGTQSISGQVDVPEGTEVFLVPTGALDYNGEPSALTIGGTGRTVAGGDLTFDPADNFDVRLVVDNQSGGNQNVIVHDGDRFVETISVGNGITTIERTYALENNAGYVITTESGSNVQTIGGSLSESELNLINAILGGSGTATGSTSTTIGQDGSTSQTNVTTTTNPDGTTTTTVSNTTGDFNGENPLPPELGGSITTGGSSITGGGDAAAEIRRIDLEMIAAGSGINTELQDDMFQTERDDFTEAFGTLIGDAKSMRDSGNILDIPNIAPFSGDASRIDYPITILGVAIPLAIDFSAPVFNTIRAALHILVTISFMVSSVKMLKV